MVSLIDKIKNERNNKKNGKKTNNNWKTFSIYVFLSLIASILMSVVGANYIFLTNLTPELKEKWLPTKTQNEELGGFYKPAKGGGEPSACNINTGSFKIPGLDSNWPYSMYKNKIVPGFIQSFKNWIAQLTATSFIRHRQLLSKWINMTSGFHDFIKMGLIGPLTLLYFPIVFMVGFLITFLSAFETSILWSFFGIFLLYIWPILNVIPFIQTIQYILLFTYTPLYSNFNDIKKVFNCNINLISLLFGFFVCISSYLTLDITTTTITSIIYAVTAIISII